MRRRIFLFAALLSGLAVVVTSVLITVLAYNNFFETIKSEVRAQASYIQSGIEAAGTEYLAGVEHQTGHRLTVISPGGAVLFDSVSSPGRMDNHLGRPEIQAALESGIGESTRYSDTSREQTYYYAVRLEDGSVMRMSSTTASILSSYDRLFWMVALIVVAVLALSAFVASLVTRRIVRPINTIDLDIPENSEVYDEIVPLLTRIREQRNQILAQMDELDRGRREFAAITENMSEGFLVLDREGRVLSHNKSALSLLKIYKGGAAWANIHGSSLRLLNTYVREVIGANILTLNRSEPFRAAVKAARAGTPVEQQIELAGRICQLYANPVVTDEGVQGIVLLLMDITEKQEREQLRREFTANVSHELKTPLTAISGYAEIIANGVAKPEDVPEFSEYIYHESQRLIALIRDLMYLSKLDEGVFSPKEPVDLLVLARAAAERLKTKADRHHVAVCVLGEAAKVYGIPSVLEEMVYNLLDNAIKYNRPGGSVTLCVEQADNSVTLCVSDTGFGIPQTEQERIFERFYRVDKSRHEAVEGTGLGLAIVKHGALLHDAEIQLESSSGGSRFCLSFSCLDLL